MSKENKLTLKICFKYPFASISCEKATHRLNCIWEYFQLKYREGKFNHSISDCKLILRPLSSLTDEEKKEIDMIQRKFSLRSLADDNDETYRKHFQRITDKLREWNIDIDSLQERGLCIYE